MSIKKTSLVGAAVAGALLLGALPAAAQERTGTSEISVYAGALFGDDLTKAPVSGNVPKLDDDFVAGLRYAYNFTPNLALEGSFGISPNKVTGLVADDIDIDVYTADINAVYNFSTGTRLTPYVTAGVGYAFANLDRPIVGTVGSQQVAIDDDEGVTANVGVGLKYDFTDRIFARVDARYRYVDKLVDQASDSLDGGEVTVGLGYRF
ncbi:MAG: porin family protein [Steroidobacteraceae bacterium]